MKLNKIIGIVAILIFSFSLVSAYEIEGNRVFEDTPQAYIQASPHTISKSGFVNFQVKSKTYSGDIYIILGFDSDNAIPKYAEYYNPHFVENTENYVKVFSDITSTNPTTSTCDYGDENNLNKVEAVINNSESIIVCYNDFFDIGEGKFEVHYSITESEEIIYSDISGIFQKQNYNYDGLNKFYVAEGININAAETETFRVFLDVVPNSAGKYGFAVKPSSMTLSESISNGAIMYLDPWFNNSFDYKRKILNHSSDLILPIKSEDIDSDTNTDYFYGQDGYIYYNSDDDFIFTNSTEDGETCGFESISEVVSCPSAPNGLVSYYTFDQSSGAAEDFISNNDGTINGATYTTSGKVNGAYDFDGNDDYVFSSEFNFITS